MYSVTLDNQDTSFWHTEAQAVAYAKEHQGEAEVKASSGLVIYSQGIAAPVEVETPVEEETAQVEQLEITLEEPKE